MGMTAFTLEALLKLNDTDFNKGLSGAEGKMSALGGKIEKIGSKIGGVGSMVSSGVKKISAAAGALAVAGAAATGKVIKGAVDAYASYEQLTGGIETLFGTSAKSLEGYRQQIGLTDKASKKELEQSFKEFKMRTEAEAIVMENAHNAYKNAGMSANEYMETVTSFSASLLQGLKGDTVKAAHISDMAMVDMADNANKMGTDMSAIQNAYQGFAKQNYTMLDNLKLGYGGTRSEMQRLLRDAGKLTGKKYNLNNLADVYEAIHVIQEEMGITGTTAEEAATTIEGSTRMMKASWENLKIAMVSKDGDISQAIADFSSSVKIAVVDNWIPAIKQGLEGFGSVISELAPIIANEIPGLVSAILPGLLTAASSLAEAVIKSLGESVPALIDGIIPVVNMLFGELVKNIPSFIDGLNEFVTALIECIGENSEALAGGAISILTAIVHSVKENLPILLSAATDILTKIVELIGENASDIISSGIDIVSQIGRSISECLELLIPAAVDMLVALADALVDPTNIEYLNTTGSSIITGLTTSIGEVLPDLVGAATDILTSIAGFLIENAPTLITGGFEIVDQLMTSIGDNLPLLVSSAVDLITKIVDGLTNADNLALLTTGASSILTGLVESIKENLPKLAASARDLLVKLCAYIKDKAPTLIKAGLDIIKQLCKSIGENLSTLLPAVIDMILEIVKDLTEPENLAKLIEGGLEIVKGLAKGIGDSISVITAKIPVILANIVVSILTLIPNLVDTLIGIIKGLWQQVTTGIKEFIKIILGPDFLDLPTAEEVRAAIKQVWEDAIKNLVLHVTGFVDVIKRFITGGSSDEPTMSEGEAQEVAEAVAEKAADVTMAVGGGLFKTLVTGGAPGMITIPNSAFKNAGGGSGGGTPMLEYGVEGTGTKLGFHDKGAWDIPYDDYLARLHRGEMVLTASQARRYRDGEDVGFSIGTIAGIVGQEVRKALSGVGIYMGSDRVADLTADRMNDNIGSWNEAILHGMGGA